MGRAYGTPVKLHALQLTEAECLAKFDRVHGLAAAAGGGKFVFRVEAVSYSCTDWNGDHYSSGPRLEVFAYEVHKWTECGATLKDFNGARRRWVDLRPESKQWASKTVAIAVEQFALRRQRQIYVLERQLRRAKQELALTKGACVTLPIVQ